MDNRGPAFARAEEIRDQRMEAEESINAALIAMLHEIKEEFMEREELNREEMRCRDNKQELMKKREKD